MKLRNKKTGDIIESEYMMLVEITSNKGERNLLFEDLTQLNNEWEDYKPVEPLIKDEKIRKAVRAWAEANGIHESRYRNVKFDHSEHRLKWIRTIIEFDSLEGLENLCDGGEYTITELCGEEEE